MLLHGGERHPAPGIADPDEHFVAVGIVRSVSTQRVKALARDARCPRNFEKSVSR